MCTVHERRVQNDTVMPTKPVVVDPGYKLDIIDFRVGGLKVKTDEKFISYVTGVDVEEIDLEKPTGLQKKALQQLEHSLVYFSIYVNVNQDYYESRLRGKSSLKTSYIPEVPYKIQMLGRIISTERSGDDLYHRVKFLYDTPMYSTEEEDITLWKRLGGFRENKDFKEIVMKLSTFRAHIEGRGRDSF